MKRAPWFLLAGAVAGFASVLGLHGRPASSAAAQLKGQRAAGGATRAGVGGGGAGGPTTAPAASGPAQTATGKMVQYGFGELEVAVTARGGRITDVTVPALRTAEPYSEQLAQQVIPMLKSEVLSAQSARINGVSGATYTSEAYAMSLQAALDKLHVK